MKTRYLAIIGGIAILIAVIWIAPNPTDVSKVFNSTNPDPQSVQKIKAIRLAESSPMVKPLIWMFGYHYDSIFYISGLNSNNTNSVKTVNVVYQSNISSIGPLVVTEDPQLTKITGVIIQQVVRNYN